MITVAIAAPRAPIGGIMLKPKINTGSRMVFKIAPIPITLAGVWVSPKACISVEIDMLKPKLIQSNAIISALHSLKHQLGFL